SYLTMEDNTIRMEDGKLHLENLTLLDTLKNRAVVNGYADLSDFGKIGFDLTLKTTNFLALHTTKSANSMYFGTVYLDSDVHLQGTQQKPVINMKIHLNKGTVLTFVPQNAQGIAESEGIVAFIDSVSVQQRISLQDSTLGKANVTEIDLKARIGIDEDVLLKLLVDPVSGDSLYVKGKADLEFSLDPSGTMSLTGRYQVTDGGYHLTVTSFLKRDFRIQKGSSITWSGEPMEADIDSTAIYKVKTSPLILLEDQMAGADDQQKNKYRNSLNFMVLLKMNGSLSKPELKFDIQLDPKDRGAMSGTVNAKLVEIREDESQLNKQVFALLALNRFIGQDPLESGNAPLTVNSAARSSASKLLTAQLNALSEKYVKGVNLNVGINSYDDYSSGQAQGRTQLQLGVSKELMQGRITVQVGGDIDLEGQKASQNNISDIAGNISIEYKLTEDGRFKLKGFRSNEYENPIEGELTKTGIGLIYTKDFNHLKKTYLREKKK
ncbi:MAG TPA: translocation/assembly module TamB domain-containing protein, partial [Bacteroidales bacterium]|nr:translocation/assembly module TamB domain-containing protein [Bacteroidales bacterium]